MIYLKELGFQLDTNKFTMSHDEPCYQQNVCVIVVQYKFYLHVTFNVAGQSTERNQGRYIQRVCPAPRC
jgi:hypothetical protein